MRLYIVRHGKATDEPHPSREFPRPEGYPDDFDRPLKPRGQEQAGYLAEHLKGSERRVGLILTSRYPRALQTARIIQAVIGADLRTAPELEVDRPVSDALRLIDEHHGSRGLMLVGHNPQLGELVSVLCAGLPPEQMILKTGELVGLDFKPQQPVGTAQLIARLRLCEKPLEHAAAR